MVSDAAIERWVRGAIESEYTASDRRMARVPSTYTWKIVDYVAALGEAERGALFDDFAANGVFFLRSGHDPALHAYRAGRPAYRGLVDALARTADWKYADARFLRGMLGDVRGKHPSPEFATVPAEVVERAEAIHPTSAADIRREVKARFAERFAATADKQPAGVWFYTGRSQGRDFRVQIDFGGMGDQLRYEVSFEDDTLGLRARRLSYEGLTGFGHGRWDFVTADNLTDTIALLVELIEWLVGIPDRLAASTPA